MRTHFIFIFCFFQISLWSQTYEDHFGNGNTGGVITSSSPIEDLNQEINSINGTGFFPDEAGAVRFLHQATFGANMDQVQALTTQGIENWIDEQIAMDYTGWHEHAEEVWAYMVLITQEGSMLASQASSLEYAFYDKIMNDEDQLRQKVAFALSQIVVASFNHAELFRHRAPFVRYYDNLYTHALGNYRDVLQTTTESRCMGTYLSYFQNQKTNFATGVTPDENYAREVMQLFTIGLWELNNDGTRKQDAFGNDIPTYDINDIQQLARVFTGYQTASDEVLVMNNNIHDQGVKVLPEGTILPAYNGGTSDVRDALDALFEHPNTAPFISIRLIQQLVKSNPSRAYVSRISNVFIDNGEGVRGDLGAVVKAILLDPEARTCNFDEDLATGKLLQPIERFTMIYKAFNLTTPSGRFFSRGGFANSAKQKFLNAPSVFNFFAPEYAEPGTIEPLGLVSPEFQILDNVTIIQYMNGMETTTHGRPFANYTAGQNSSAPQINNNDEPVLDFSLQINIYQNQGAGALVEHLNLLLCRNQLTNESKDIIEDALNAYQNQINGYNAEQAVRDAIYFIVCTPSFTILK